MVFVSWWCHESGGRLTPLPTQKFWWVSDLCPIFFFPSIKGIYFSHLRARAPLIMFLSISFIMYKVLYAVALPLGIYNFVNVPLLSAILSDYRSWSGSQSGKRKG